MSCLRIVCISDTHGQHVKLRVRDVPAGNKTIAGRAHNAQLMLSILAPLHGPTITVTPNQRPQIPILIQLVSSLPFT